MRVTGSVLACTDNTIPSLRIGSDNYSFETYPSPFTLRLPLRSTILSDSNSDKILEGRPVDLIAFMKINRPRFLRLKPGVEELVRVRKTGALEEVHLHIPLESTDRYNQPIVRPDGRVPLPFFGDPPGRHRE